MITRPGAIESAVIITEPIAASALDRSKIVVVLESAKTIGRAGAVEIAVRSKISIALESDTIAAVESSGRKPALIERRHVPTRIERALTERGGHRTRAHR
jgi:hypothetical protein